MPEEPRQHQAGPSGQRERARRLRAAHARQAAILPQEEGLPLLRRSVDFIDYKKVEMLQPFVQEPRQDPAAAHDRHCSRHQRWLGEAIKRGAQHCAAAVCHCTLGTWSGASIEFWSFRSRSQAYSRHQPPMGRYKGKADANHFAGRHRKAGKREARWSKWPMATHATICCRASWAIEASAGNVKRLEKIRTVLAKRTANEKGGAEKLAELLAAVSVKLKAQVRRKTINSLARSLP